MLLKQAALASPFLALVYVTTLVEEPLPDILEVVTQVQTLSFLQEAKEIAVTTATNNNTFSFCLVLVFCYEAQMYRVTA